MTSGLTSEQMDLHAYVDGQLSAEGRRRVDRYLEEHPEARQQVADYRALNQHLQQFFAPVMEEPIPPELLQRPPRRSRWRPLGLALAACLLLSLGGLLGWQLRDQLELAPIDVAGTPEYLVREAAMAYAVYSPEVRHPVEVYGNEKQHLVAWLSKRMRTRVRAPDLSGLGMQLVGGRLLSSEDGPGVMLMYEDSSGRRVILYACHAANDNRTTAFRFARQDGVSVFYWIDKDLSYALAGELDRPLLEAVADRVYQELMI